MSTSLNKKRLLPKEQQGTKSPKTPRTVKQVKELKASITPSSTTIKTKDTRKSAIQSPRVLKEGTTPIKVGKKVETPTRRKLLNTKTVAKEQQDNDSFSTIVLEQKQCTRENPHTPKSKMHDLSCDTNSSIKVSVRVRPFSER